MDKKYRFDPRACGRRFLRLTPAALACSLLLACGGADKQPAESTEDAGSVGATSWQRMSKSVGCIRHCPRFRCDGCHC